MDHGHKDADRAVYENIDPQVLRSVCLANQIRRENVDLASLDKWGLLTNHSLCLTRGCELATTTRVKTGLWKF